MRILRIFLEKCNYIFPLPDFMPGFVCNLVIVEIGFSVRKAFNNKKDNRKYFVYLSFNIC
jgi:hypothetical protein